MLILATDSAIRSCSAALCDNGTITSTAQENTPNRQAERLLLLTNQVLKEQNKDYSSIDLLVSTIGPGSFTGLRIALAATQGISLANNIPVCGITTLQAMAQGYQKHYQNQPKASLSIIIDARRDNVFFQRFSSENNCLIAQSDALMLTIEQLPQNINSDDIIVSNCPDLLTGSLTPPLHGNIFSTSVTPDAASAALFAHNHYNKENTTTYPSLTPLYIRPPDAIIPKKVYTSQS